MTLTVDAVKAAITKLAADAPPPAIAPFNAEQAKQHQEAWAKHLGVPVEYTNSIGMKFRLIPPGEFLMGGTSVEIEEALKLAGDNSYLQQGLKSEAPQHKVILTRPFYLGIHEVTQGQYQKIIGMNPSHFAPMGEGNDAVVGLDTSSHPVEFVSWNDAVEFCGKLSKKEKVTLFDTRTDKTATTQNRTGYRLPTEAEWEFACRAGTSTKYWVGDADEELVQAGWFGANGEKRTHSVGDLKMNPFGLHDSHGNVQEWVQDRWEPSYYGQFQEKHAIDPSGSSLGDLAHVYRDGGFGGDAVLCRTSGRYFGDATSRRSYIGFRVALPVDAVKAAIAERSVQTPPPAIAPFNAEEARQHQAAWAKSLGVPVEYTNSIGMKFRLIPPGEFLMGSTEAEVEAALTEVEATPPMGNKTHWKSCVESETPQQRVLLTQPVYVGVYEVTQFDYAKVIGSNPSHNAATGEGKDAVVGLDTTKFPVDSVTWNEIAEFCDKLSTLEKFEPGMLAPRANDKVSIRFTGYRLPTEAEWEFACRAGTKTNYWSGDTTEDLAKTGWFADNSAPGRTHSVGELLANPFGLFDMHGNVWERVLDRWELPRFESFRDRLAIDPCRLSDGGSNCVALGGSWVFGANLCRSATRGPVPPQFRGGDIGFRVALTVDAVKAAIAERTADAPPPAIAPFDAEQAKQHQAAWAKSLGVPVEYTNSIGMKFRLIPPGEFTMGSTAEEIEAALKIAADNKPWPERIQSEAPQHKVILTRPIYFGVHEVTQKDYAAVMGKKPSHWSSTGEGSALVSGIETTSHPVETVSSSDAAEFCAKLSKLEKLKPFYDRVGETVASLVGNGYRLPTEAEWEFACRAGTTTKYWIGDQDEDLPQAGSFAANSGGRTHPVGELKANPFGMFDIHGNVWEWVQDGWEPTDYHQFQNKAAIDPSRPATADSQHVVRGGYWGGHATYCRSSLRGAVASSYRNDHIGFRVALTVDAVKAAIAERTAEAPLPAIAPFDAEQAKQHQAAWAKSLGVPVEYTNSIGMKVRLIPPGEFTMGSTAAEIEQALKDATDFNNTWHTSIKSEAPQHKVMLTQSIYFGVHEVTQAQYEKVMGRNPSHFTPTGGGKEAVEGMDTSLFSVDTVTWNDAVEFSVKLSQQEKLRPFLLDDKTGNLSFDGNGYRLPTEAEWEFACRAGTTTRFWSGDQVEDLLQVGWFNTNNSQHRAHAVGELKPNPFGLYDIHGNLWEWVQDRWESTYYAQHPGRPAIDPRGPLTGGALRVRRSGDWFYGATYCRSSCRNVITPAPSARNIGFRVALTVDAVKAAIAERATPGE